MLIKEIHIIRALAALSIVAIHVSSGQAGSYLSVYIANQITRFASPIFIIISGFILFWIETTRPSPTLSYFYRRRFNKIAIPYVVWSLFYTLYKARHFLSDPSLSSVKEVIAAFFHSLYTGTAFVHLYFILIMVQLYAIFPFLYKYSKLGSKNLLVVTFTVTVVSISLIYFQVTGWLVLPSIHIPYVYLVVSWIFYFVLGMYFAKHYRFICEKLTSRKNTIYLGLGWIAALILLMWDGKATNTFGMGVKPSTFIYGVISFFFIYHVLISCKMFRGTLTGSVSSVVNWIAKNSFLIYLVHPFCLNVIVRTSFIGNFHKMWHGPFGAMLLMVVTVMGTFICVAVINQMPFAVWLGGNKQSSKVKTGKTVNVSKNF